MANGNWDTVLTWNTLPTNWDSLNSGDPSEDWDTAELTWAAQSEDWDELGISFDGLPSQEAFGTATELRAISYMQGIAGEEAFGTTSVAPAMQPVGIASGEVFGSPEADPQPVWLTNTGIASEEAFGSIQQMDFIMYATSIEGGEAFGQPRASINGYSDLARDSQVWNDQDDDSQVWVDQTKQVTNWS